MSFNTSSAAARLAASKREDSLHPSSSSGLRVMSSGLDPADEVRTTLATLNARAQQLVRDGVDHRGVCNGRSLYEVSRQAVEGTREQVRRATAGDAYAPTTQASVELFMAKHLGFDVQGQQRLLAELHNSQRQMVADIANTEGLGASGAGAGGVAAAVAGSMGGGAGGIRAGSAGNMASVDAVVARLKGELIAQAQNDVHQRQKELLQRQEYAVFKAAWTPFYVSMADDFELLAMRQANPDKADLKSDTAALAAARARYSNGNGYFSGASAGIGPNSGLASLLNSGSPVADELNRKVAAFAPIVRRYPPAQWISHFSAYIRDRVVSSGDELAALWVTAERILGAVDTQGSGANTMSYVAASRMVMEEKALGRLLTSAMRIDPSRVEEVANMPSGRVMDVITRASGTSNAWVHIFDAMRVGRYDVAVDAAKRTGHAAVEEALRKYAEASPLDRVKLAPALDLRELYAETRRASTGSAASPSSSTTGGNMSGHGNGGTSPTTGNNGRNSPLLSNGTSPAASTTTMVGGDVDVHKQAVLFLLLVGATGETSEVNRRVMLDLCSRLNTSLEDVLWMRLFCVRSIEETAKGGFVQSLSSLQRLVMDDLQDLVTMAHGNLQRIASFLVHALLPSSGLRLLLENDLTCVDGLHLVLCFNEANILQCSPLETPVDVAKHIARYCSIVLLDTDRRSLDGVMAGAAVFDYFHKSGFDEAFAEFCLKDVVATKLFGQRGIVAVSPAWSPLLGGGESISPQQRQQLDGLLMIGGGPLSPDLLQAMANTAELAALQSNTPLALHLLLSLARACLRSTGANSSSSSSSSGVTRGQRGAAPGEVHRTLPSTTMTGLNAQATALAALQRAVKLACPAMAQAFYMPPHTTHASALFNTCAQLRVAVREAGVDALSSLSDTSSGANGGAVLVRFDVASGTPQLTRGDLAAFETLCTMADVFLSAHAARLEQTLRSFFALPFIPDMNRLNDVERCVAGFGADASSSAAPGASVVMAAAAIVPLAFRAAASLLQVYAQQQQQQRGSAAAEAAARSAVSLGQAMQLVCQWLHRCGSQSSSGSSGGGGFGTASSGAGVSLYEACVRDVEEFESNYL